MQKMAVIVDKQNAPDPKYCAMSVHYEKSLGFQAGLDLVSQRKEVPNGYAGSLLQEYRRKCNAAHQLHKLPNI